MITVPDKPKGIAASTFRLADAMFAACRTQPVRSMAQFAIEEMFLPADGGPHEGERLRWETQPFSRLLYEQFDDARWQEIMVTGPSQSGKTYLCFVTPICYVVAELRKNLVVAVPDLNMADDKWRIDIQPVFLASPKLSRLLPISGPGSKGGVIKNSVTFTNGVTLKFMSPFGDDANRAGFTAPFVIVTEAARFSDPSDRSVEADPLRQLKARQRSVSRFDADRQLTTGRRLLVEGTVTLEDELPWRARAGSTASRIVCPCPHCRAWVTPERGDLVGWQEATSELQAAESAYFACPSCGEAISDAERRQMNLAAKLIHEGQRVEDGEIVGEAPRTMRLFFRWSGFNNLFASPADLAVEEWSAAQLPEESEDRQNAEKDLCQSLWSIPYVPPRIDVAPLSRDAVSKRRDRWPIGMLPPDTELLTGGVDVGRWRCWYFLIAARATGQLPCVFFGSLDTSLTNAEEVTPMREAQAIAACLSEIDDLFEQGFAQEGSGVPRRPDMTFFDSNYFTDVVFDWIRTRNGDESVDELRRMPILGRGRTQFDGRAYQHPTKLGNVVRRIGTGWYLSYERGRQAFRVTLDADQAKLDVQDALRVDPQRPGSIVLPHAPRRDLEKLARHLSAEVKDSTTGEWKKTGQNHLLDCAAYAYAALGYLGWELPEAPVPIETPSAKPATIVPQIPTPAAGWLASKGIRL